MATDARDLTNEAPERINVKPENVDLGPYKFGWSDPVRSVFTPKRGLSHDVVEEISAMKNEPEWMRKFRHKALDQFYRRPMPSWGADLSDIDFDNIFYFLRATEQQAESWEDLPEDIKNTYDKLGIPEAEKQRLVAGVAAQYECLSGSSGIWTANRGMARIKEIEPGDRVFALDESTGRFIVAPVKAAAQTDVRQTYEVKVGLRTIRATDNHPFLVLSDERKPGRQRARYQRRWKTLAELKVGDLVAVPRGLPEFGESRPLPPLAAGKNGRLGRELRTSPDLMWLLGFYIGDGSLQQSGKTHRVQFAVHESDPEVRAEITRIVREQFGLNTIEPADGQRVVVNSKALVEWFQNIGVAGSAFTKQVPEWVFRLPLAERLAFLGGWVDADGYIRPTKDGAVMLTSVNAPMLEQARELAELSGLRAAGPYEFSGRHPFDAGRTMYGRRLQITGDFDRLDCRNPKRTARFGRRAYFHSNTSAHGTTFHGHTTEHLGFARVTAITPAEVEPVYDIEVDGPHNFIAEGMVVHNSEVVYHKIREDLEERGVVFLDTDTALREHEDLFREHWATVIPSNDNKFSALNSAVWSGGCLTADARINVKGKGLVGIAEIEPGDEVFGADPGRDLQRGKVLDRVESGVKPVYRLRVAGRTLEATGNHQFLVARRVQDGGRTRWTAVWAPLDEIEVGEPIAITRVLPDDGERARLPKPAPYVKNHSLQQLGFPSHTDEDLLWLLGLWLGDGHTATPGKHMRQVSFSVPATDTVYDTARSVVRSLFGAYTTPVKCGFILSSKAFGTWLDDLGFTGHAKTKRLPQWIYALPHEQQLALLGGLIDADGWTENSGATMSIELANRELLEDVRQLAIGCGLHADGKLTERTRTITFADGHTVTSTCWRLRVQGDLSRVGTRDPAKWGKMVSRGRASRYSAATGLNFSSLATDTVGFALLQEKEYVDEKPTYDIQVVGLENFVANGIVAHNSFIWVPEGVHVEIPLQAYFRINAQNMGQFERTLIIAEPGSSVHYIEGCTAPVYSSDSLHSAVVEIFVKEDAKVRYTTIQNWSNNVYNLVTKRAAAHKGATMEWIDGNIGSKVTMKYPAVLMLGEHAHGEVLSVAMAGKGQHQDAGAKLTFAAPNTTGQILSKSISRDSGRASYRGLIKVTPNATGAKANVRCDALMLDDESRSDTYPYMDIKQEDVTLGHEATVSKIGDDQLFYLQSRGLSEEEAVAMIVRGFIEPIAKELPMEYALELNRLISLQMEGAVG